MPLARQCNVARVAQLCLLGVGDSAPDPPKKVRLEKSLDFVLLGFGDHTFPKHLLMLHIGVGISDSVNQLPLFEYF